MQLSRRVALNGLQLDEIDESIVIQSIDEAAGNISITAEDRGAGDGQRVIGRRRPFLDITVRFGIDIPKTDMERREEVLEAVNSWAAAGGVLTVGHKPNRRVSVILAQAPGMGNARAWTSEFALLFRAYAVPYWEDASAAVNQSIVSTGAAVNADVGGNADTVLDITLENMSGMEITAVTVTAGNRVMKFTSLGMMGGERLIITHEDGLLRLWIRAANGNRRSVMLKRSEDSSDDMTVSPGTVRCAFTATRACRMTVQHRGRWL